jgi:1-acyl-sn-glycerol-3-phosphate acyltransferase
MAEELITSDTLRRSILDDMFKDFDHSRRWMRKILEPFAWLSADRFAGVCARFDATVARAGFREAMRELLDGLVKDVNLRGLEHVPSEGPLLIVSNHPGSYDSVAIAANLPRDDLQIIATGFPVLRRLPNARQHLIFTDPHAGANPSVARTAIQHLRSGGSVLIFPRGRVEPDPAVLPGAEEGVSAWSPSVELLLRRAPQTIVQMTIVSGVLAPIFLRNPLLKIWKGLRDPQAIAEVTQILTQMLFANLVKVTPTISFGDPITVDELRSKGESLYQSIISEASRLLDDHIQDFSLAEDE